jgi:putative transposase
VWEDVIEWRDKKEEEISEMPHLQATVLHVSPFQHELLERMVHRTTNAQRLVKRGQIILEAASGISNRKIAQHVQMDYETVRRWRDRWHAAESRLEAIEATGKPKQLAEAIEVLLSDEQRPGAPATFTLEQFMQIMALACERPTESDRPVTDWTPSELADEAVKRGIVEQISPRTVGRFLKGECFTASSQSVLAHAAARRAGGVGQADL